jgi:hypothetical protein
MREPAQFAPAVAGDAEKSVDCCASCGYFHRHVDEPHDRSDCDDDAASPTGGGPRRLVTTIITPTRAESRLDPRRLFS